MFSISNLLVSKKKMEDKKEYRRKYNAAYLRSKKDDVEFWAKKRAAQRASYQKNREYYIAQSIKWKRDNKHRDKYRFSVRAKLMETKHNARTRNIEWNVTDEHATERFKRPCAYCGKMAKEGAWNGIDRIDNTRGYEIDNCAPSCFRCNKAKGIMSLKEFFEMCRDVVAYQIKNISS